MRTHKKSGKPMCRHVFERGDQSVQKGKRLMGELCPSVAMEGQEFCYYHCVSHKIIPHSWAKRPDKEKKDITSRIKGTNSHTIRTKGRKYKPESPPLEGAASIANLVNPVSRKNVEEFFGMGECNLVDVLDEQRQLIRNGDSSGQNIEKFPEKVAFCHWLRSSSTKRTPKSLYEVARVLGVNGVTLDNWKSSAFVKGWMDADLKSNTLFIDRIMAFRLMEIMQGTDDKDAMRAIEIYQKHFYPELNREEKKVETVSLTQDEDAEVKSICEKADSNDLPNDKKAIQDVAIGREIIKLSHGEELGN